MKHCPTCDRYFRDRIDRCPTDGAVLQDANAVFTFLPHEKTSPEAREASTQTDEAARLPREQGPSVSMPKVHDHVPPHDDWESWGARLTADGVRRSTERPPIDVDASRANVSRLTDRLRENARAQWFELLAAAFGFGTLGFLLHVMAMSPSAKQSRPEPPRTASVASVANPRAVASTQGLPQSWEKRPPPAAAASVAGQELMRRNTAAVRGTSPVAPRVAWARGVPRRALDAPTERTRGSAPSTAVADAGQARAHYAYRREARIERAYQPRSQAAQRTMEPAYRAAPRSSERTAWAVAPRPRQAQYTARSTVRIRTASGRWNRWTPHARALAGEPPARPVAHRSTAPSNVDPSYERIQGDPDREVIGLSDSISRSRSIAGAAHGPFGISTPQGDKHVVYVIDSSSSMGATWRLAAAEVTNSIRSLGPDDTFDIVTFNRRAHAFSSTLMPAIPGTEASIIDYLRYVRVGGDADLRQALWLAMELPNVNEIVLVTTAPTAGETDLRRLAGFASSENRNRVRIDTVALVDGGRGASTGGLLGRIAHDSGGQSRMVNVD